MLIIAHRANITGAEPALENSRDRTRECIARGWSVETDIRRDESGRFYVSHDETRWTPENDASAMCAVWRQSRALIALNIKELGYEADLIAFLRQHDALSHVFLFDMELLETHAGATAQRFRELDERVLLGARVSDRNEPVERALDIDDADVIWLDEFDGPWATAADISALKRAGRVVLAVSPELHGASLSDAQCRWSEFIAWGIDGICTDAPELLEHMLAESKRHVIDRHESVRRDIERTTIARAA